MNPISPYTTSSASGWSLTNPKHVVGINAAVEYCDWTETTCTLTNTWPRATFDWPPGMPRTMYIGTSKVDVTDAQGLTTRYGFTAYDLALKEGGVVADGYVPGQEYSPRLTSISPPNASNRIKVTYNYKNLFLPVELGIGFDKRLQTSGVTKGATRGGLSVAYDMLRPFYTDSQNIASGVENGIFMVQVQGHVNGAQGVIYFADTDDGRVNFEITPRNFPVSFQKNAAPHETYEYTRGNLTRITYAPSGRFIRAQYPNSCTPSTRKTCNQATSMWDASGNRTDYEYHPQSGQVSRITYPANKHGVRPETRYEYAQFRASYYNSSGTKTLGDPIWLKTTEKYCINSSSTGNGCAGNDEVVTTFEYNHDNLLMTGMTVTDPATGETLRTCYQYDIYGNQIGVTKPKANLATCPRSD